MVGRYMQKIEALHAAVAQGSLREVQAMLGRAKLALSKVPFPFILSSFCKYYKGFDNMTETYDFNSF